MSAITALIGFTAWTLAIVFIVLNWRVIEVLRGKPANSWTRGAAIESPSFVKRAEHAHLNCLENLPVFAVIVLAAQALGKSAVVDAVACWVLYARIAQSSVHLIGTQPMLVLVRASLYGIQVGLFAYMLWRLAA
ncbi:MAPEG family protein [Sinimarinibacterium sp. CAU 1509]|uniref:MAPEG family protein n=1 Tax=Sinimarinibacterium sp. CAU 1509 TaxID=2562283 RepID=UPI00200ABE77|nr:MAPEG family protein [Sinimarinibacterium sp. CAU 1509]